jgi:hypothetical protein
MTDHGHVAHHEQTGWVGWIAFASIFMVLAGFFQGIYGLAAIFRNSVIVAGFNSTWLVNLTTRGWVHFILGVVLVLTGFGLMSGGIVSRTLAVILVGLSAIANFLFIPVYPVWSIVVLVLDALVIYAIIAHGGEVRDMEDY